MFTVAVVVGSLRRESINLRLARALARLAEGRLECRFIGVGDLPIYNDDLWADPPAAVLRFKAEVAACDAVLFVSPEYNRSMTPALKNAVDWGSRPVGQSVWGGKPAAIAGASGGVIGTAVAQSQLRSTALVLDMIVMGQPELYLRFTPDLIDAQGQAADDKTRAFLAAFVDRFAGWVERMAPARH
jgi:chromate reductase